MKKNFMDFIGTLSNTLPFMEGKEKGDMKELIEGKKPVTIKEFGFLAGEENEDYAVVVFNEIPEKFFFAPSVLSQHLIKANDEGFTAEEIGKVGILFETKMSKNKRKYTNVTWLTEPF